MAGMRNLSIILLTLAANLVPASPAAQADITWGANGHPLVAYRGIKPEQQLDLLKAAGLRSYRVDVTDAGELKALRILVNLARARGIDILPVITPTFDLDKLSAQDLYRKSFNLAVVLIAPLKDHVRVWELGNELENYAILKACETRDDGTQNSCFGGDAVGSDRLSYSRTRWSKVSAVLKGLSDGAKSVDPTILRAMGSAGWGHTGSFALMRDDGIDWDISVWHMYGEDPEWAFKILKQYGHPIWVTEFNNPYGSQSGEEEQADGLEKAMTRLRALSATYDIQAAHIYELLDETYWAPSYEAYMGLVRIEKTANAAWQPGKPKAAYLRLQKILGLPSASSPDGTAAGPVNKARIADGLPGQNGTRALHRSCDLTRLAAAATTPRRQLGYAYCLILGRPADSAGLGAWLQEHAQGMSLLSILQSMTGSDEFAAKQGVSELSNTAYVRLLYRIFFNREADGAGLTSYVSELDRREMTRSQLVGALLNSDEFRSAQPMFFAQHNIPVAGAGTAESAEQSRN